jgi:hypothetical protein
MRSRSEMVDNKKRERESAGGMQSQFLSILVWG